MNNTHTRLPRPYSQRQPEVIEREDERGRGTGLQRPMTSIVGNLVPRVSLLLVKSDWREEERPWERGCIVG